MTPHNAKAEAAIYATKPMFADLKYWVSHLDELSEEEQATFANNIDWMHNILLRGIGAKSLPPVNHLKRIKEKFMETYLVATVVQGRSTYWNAFEASSHREAVENYLSQKNTGVAFIKQQGGYGTVICGVKSSLNVTDTSICGIRFFDITPSAPQPKFEITQQK